MIRSTSLTQALCKSLAPPSVSSKLRDIEYSDTVVKGLKLSVSKNGMRCFNFRYTYLGNKGFIRIGCFPATTLANARKIARNHLSSVDKGIDPKLEQVLQREMPNFETFVREKYLPAAQRKRSFRSDESKIRLHLIPNFKGLKLNQVTQIMVQDYLNGISQSHCEATSNRHRSLLSSIFKMAIAHKLITENPCQHLKKLKEAPPPPHYLDDAQIACVLTSLAQDDNVVAAAALKFLLLTGLRLNEVLSAEWSNVDFSKQQLYLPQTKAGSGRYVPLNIEALKVLTEQFNCKQSQWVFPGKDPSKPLNNPRKAWRRVLNAAGIDQPVRIHDIRHSFASACVRHGVPLYTVQQLLGHASHATTQRYAHLNQSELRTASQHAIQGFVGRGG